MKKTTISLVVLIVILVAGGIYAFTQKNEKSNSVSTIGTNLDWKPYINEQVGLSLNYPASFSASNQASSLPNKLITFYDTSSAFPVHEEGNSISIFAFSAKEAPTFERYIEKYPIINGNTNKPFSFKSRSIGQNTFYYTLTERFEGTLSFAYYTLRNGMVYQFNSVSQGVDWTNSNLDVESDSIHMTLKQMLESLKFLY